METTTMTKYQAIPGMHRDVTIEVIGCGGTGALVLQGLGNIATSLYKTGSKRRIDVVAYDPDVVSSANIGRQPFYPAEIGQNKAVCLVNRVNMSFGLDWEACPEAYNIHNAVPFSKIIIGCVDSRKSRRSIKDVLERHVERYYIDCGNDRHSGQVLIGCNTKKKKHRLPMPWEVCPALVSEEPEDNTPSCSLAEALNSQDLMVNRFAAMIALELVWQLLKYNTLKSRGAFFDCRNIKVMPVAIGNC